MIRKTLRRTQEATYCIELPEPAANNIQRPIGTGFFVSSDGYFITAAHVITEDGTRAGTVRKDIHEGWLRKERRFDREEYGCVYGGMAVHTVLPEFDFALLKVDFAPNAPKVGFVGKTGFPFVSVSRRQLEEGELVYSFGYPLAKFQILSSAGQFMMAHDGLCPRTTSAIVSSTFEVTKPAMASNEPEVYVLDKALNYGNSGGPILATETGHAHAWCSRFQPVTIKQEHLPPIGGMPVSVKIPSLYGVVGSLHHGQILELLGSVGVPLVTP